MKALLGYIRQLVSLRVLNLKIHTVIEDQLLVDFLFSVVYYHYAVLNWKSLYEVPHHV